MFKSKVNSLLSILFTVVFFFVLPTCITAEVSEEIIGPAISPLAQNFNVDGSSSWYEPVNSSDLDIKERRPG